MKRQSKKYVADTVILLTREAIFKIHKTYLRRNIVNSEKKKKKRIEQKTQGNRYRDSSQTLVELGEPCRREGEKNVGSNGVENNGKIQTTESTKQGS